jgi:hypothetical protein
VGCIYLAKDREQTLANVNAVTNFRVPQNAGDFLTEELLAF